jgi:hypothetical protein
LNHTADEDVHIDPLSLHAIRVMRAIVIPYTLPIIIVVTNLLTY